MAHTEWMGQEGGQASQGPAFSGLAAEEEVAWLISLISGLIKELLATQQRRGNFPPDPGAETEERSQELRRSCGHVNSAKWAMCVLVFFHRQVLNGVVLLDAYSSISVSRPR